MKTILLPPSEDTRIKIVVGDKSAEVEAIELDWLFVEANRDAKESGKHWVKEATTRLNNKFQLSISDTQTAVLYEGVQTILGELKQELRKQLKPSAE